MNRNQEDSENSIYQSLIDQQALKSKVEMRKTEDLEKIISQVKQNSKQEQQRTQSQRIVQIFLNNTVFNERERKQNKPTLSKCFPCFYPKIDAKSSYITQMEREDIIQDYFVSTNLREAETRLRNLKIWDKIPIFQPQNYFLIVWEILMLFIIILFFFIIPIENQVWDEVKNLKKQIIFYTPVFSGCLVTIYILDIILYFNVGYYDQGLLVKNRKLIAKQYLKFKFIINMIGLIILINDLFFDIGFIDILNYLFFLKLYNVGLLNQQIMRLTSLHHKTRTIYDVVKLILAIYFIAHIAGTIFMWISIYCVESLNIPLQYTWIGSFQPYQSSADDQQKTIYTILFTDKNWGLAYLYGIWWAIANMVTLGSSIVPENPYETFVGLFAEFVSIIMYGFVISFIMNIVNQLYASDNLKNSYILAMDQYMKSRKIDNNLQARVQAYIDFIVDRDKYGLQNEVLEKLNPNLRNELQMSAQGRCLKQIPWMQNNFTPQFLEDLANEIQEVTLDKNLQQMEVLDTSLNFIIRGEVEVYLNLPTYSQKRLTIKKLKKGQFWGDYSLITGQHNGRCYQSLRFIPIDNYITVYQLTRENFIKILKKHNKDFEKFSEIKDSINLEKKFHLIESQCEFCGSINHLFTNCSKFTAQFNKQAIKLNIIQDQQQVRNQVYIQRCQKKRKRFFLKNYDKQKQQKIEFLLKNSQEIKNLTDKEFKKNISHIKNYNNEQIADRLDDDSVYKNLVQWQTQSIHKTIHFYDLDIDKIKEFKTYMVHNNASLVIQNHNIIQERLFWRFFRNTSLISSQQNSRRQSQDRNNLQFQMQSSSQKIGNNQNIYGENHDKNIDL